MSGNPSAGFQALRDRFTRLENRNVNSNAIRAPMISSLPQRNVAFELPGITRNNNNYRTNMVQVDRVHGHPRLKVDPHDVLPFQISPEFKGKGTNPRLRANFTIKNISNWETMV